MVDRHVPVIVRQQLVGVFHMPIIHVRLKMVLELCIVSVTIIGRKFDAVGHHVDALTVIDHCGPK